MQDVTIGITGGIGAGKSVVSRALRCNGFHVYDCDAEAKIIMVKNVRVKEALARELGKDIYLENGELDRGKLASLIFGNANIRQFVNGIVHAAVRESIREKRIKIKGRFFIESAIISTGKIAELCNRIWLITAPLEERLVRVMQRDKTCISDIHKRIDSQEKEFSELDPDKLFIIENDETHPVLPVVLKKTDKFTNFQEYKILC